MSSFGQEIAEIFKGQLSLIENLKETLELHRLGIAVLDKQIQDLTKRVQALETREPEAQ